MLKNLNSTLIGAILVAAVVIGGAIYFSSGNCNCPEDGSGKSSDLQAVAGQTVDFINNNLLSGGTKASLIDAVEENGLLKLNIRIGESEFPSYVSKNGNLLFQPGSEIDVEQFLAEKAKAEEENQESKEVPTSDNPEVKVFVMSYCPYGLQAQKMFLPVYNLLKDEADMKIHYVNYIMHGEKEIDENLNQYCIQKEQESKFYNYLSCFVGSDDSEGCMAQAGVDKAAVEDCISSTDQEFGITEKYNDQETWLNGRFPRFDIETALNTQYEVSGSPTIVINGAKVNVNRSPESFKEAICAAFNSQPEACNQELSNQVASTGIGEATGSTPNSGGCGQ